MFSCSRYTIILNNSQALYLNLAAQRRIDNVDMGFDVKPVENSKPAIRPVCGSRFFTNPLFPEYKKLTYEVASTFRRIFNIEHVTLQLVAKPSKSLQKPFGLYTHCKRIATLWFRGQLRPNFKVQCNVKGVVI
jgi:hypothetical protein